MGKLIVTEFMTLDGVAQAPGGPEEDTARRFLAWRMAGALHGRQEPATRSSNGRRSMDALLLGRRTYDIFAGYWPTADADSPFTGLLNRVPKYVASRTLADPLAWQNSTLLSGSIAKAIESLKAAPRARSTSSGVSTSCRRSCGLASSINSNSGFTRCCSEVARGCSRRARCPRRCASSSPKPMRRDVCT